MIAADLSVEALTPNQTVSISGIIVCDDEVVDGPLLSAIKHILSVIVTDIATNCWEPLAERGDVGREGDNHSVPESQRTR